MDFSQLKGAQDHIDAYASLTSGQGFGIPRGAKEMMQKHAEYIRKNLGSSAQRTAFTKIKSHANALYVADEISDSDREFIHKTYSPTVKESTQMDIQEKMTDTQMKKREEMVKSMKKKFGDFKKRYGERAKEVMYATATKQAMKSEETEQIEERKDYYARVSPEMTHHRLVGGKPNVPKKIDSRDIHLHHLGTGNPTGEKAQYKVIAVGPKSPLALKNGLKVGSKIGGTEVNDHMDYGTGGGTVHVHTARPKSYFMDDMDESVQQDQHYCAKHVYSDVYGEGVVVEGQHADPDESGNIEWYTVQFEHGEEVIFTEDVEVMMAEYHNNHSPMKKKAKKAKE
jgi:hypothetical protein